MQKIPENKIVEYKDDNDTDNNSTNKDREEKIVDIMNIFQTYYKILFKKDKNVNMFDCINIEDETSTNRSLELFYEHIFKYKDYENKNKIEFIELYNEDDEDVMKLNSDELYALLIENNISKLSPSLFSIISYLANNYNWRTTIWKIINLKEN